MRLIIAFLFWAHISLHSDGVLLNFYCSELYKLYIFNEGLNTRYLVTWSIAQGHVTLRSCAVSLMSFFLIQFKASLGRLDPIYCKFAWCGRV
jgi:hypothetical protein